MRGLLFACALLLIAPARALAWGHEGHEIIADIAYAELTPAVKAKLDAMLASDTDPLTAHDIASEATWADVYRSAGHRETAAWHFVDDEVDQPADLKSACFGYALRTPAGCGPDVSPISLPDAHQTSAQAAAVTQLQKGGVRLALILNQALSP